jgi:thiamine-phosphate pyrophosphorylase
MDDGLIAWARQVKLAGAPALWLFTDARVGDLLDVIGRLPAGLCGVVFRHDDAPDRAALAGAVAKLCRAKKIPLVVAGDARLAAALRAGVHLRQGRREVFGKLRGGRLVTASAHNIAELRRARRAGADIVFVSPVFPTTSHVGARVLGVFGFLRMARAAGAAKPYGLGGIDGDSVRRLGRFCSGAGAIDAFLYKPAV